MIKRPTHVKLGFQIPLEEYIFEKTLFRGYILGVLTHTTVGTDTAWGGEETLT